MAISLAVSYSRYLCQSNRKRRSMNSHAPPDTYSSEVTGLTAFNGVQWSPRVSPSVFWQWVKAGYISPSMPVHWPSFDPFPLPASAMVQQTGYRAEAREALLNSGLALQHDGVVICPNNGSLGDVCVHCSAPAVRTIRVTFEDRLTVWVGVCAHHRPRVWHRRPHFGLRATQLHDGKTMLVGVNPSVRDALPLVA
jgi:hypothetical protein